MDMNRSRALYYSGGMHVALLLAMIFGLPDLFEAMREPEPMVISVEVLPVSEMSNVMKGQKLNKEKKAKADDKPVPPKPQPKVQTEAPAEPEKKEELPKDKPEEKKPDPVKEAEVKKPEPDVKKVEKKKEEKKKEKPKEVDELDSILKAVKEEAQEKKDDVAKDDASATSENISDKYDASQPLSLSERDAIVSQFYRCWSIPSGAKDAYKLVVTLKVVVAADGTVQQIELAKDKARYVSDTFFRAAADSAVRAVKMCSPLKNLPADKYDTWKDMELTFNPKDLLF
jgi:outer membrane biosynthesis protein TonB